MGERNIIDVLNDRVAQILQHHQQHSQALNVLKEQIAHKDEEIAKLRDDIAMKDMEIEAIVSKIESILG